MQTNIQRNDAIALLKEYNPDPFHMVHALTMEGIMAYMADKLGYGAEKDFWAMVGLLHDVDFGTYPEEHLQHARRLLETIDAEEELIHAVLSHGYGICSDVEPTHEMEKVLFAMDELSGLIWAGVLVRPSGSLQDMEVKSVKKKFKDKHFAAGCNRDIIRRGAEQLGWEMADLQQQTLEAMKADEARLRQEVAKWAPDYPLPLQQ
ncbi:MAG: HD domain-containing protein [Clostridiales bacterium]|nr:HD domain-containing protein [Clostridiales bacterium]